MRSAYFPHIPHISRISRISPRGSAYPAYFPHISHIFCDFEGFYCIFRTYLRIFRIFFGGAHIPHIFRIFSAYFPQGANPAYLAHILPIFWENGGYIAYFWDLCCIFFGHVSHILGHVLHICGTYLTYAETHVAYFGTCHNFWTSATFFSGVCITNYTDYGIIPACWDTYCIFKSHISHTVGHIHIFCESLCMFFFRTSVEYFLEHISHIRGHIWHILYKMPHIAYFFGHIMHIPQHLSHISSAYVDILGHVWPT